MKLLETLITEAVNVEEAAKAEAYKSYPLGDSDYERNHTGQGDDYPCDLREPIIAHFKSGAAHVAQVLVPALMDAIKQFEKLECQCADQTVDCPKHYGPGRVRSILEKGGGV